LEQLIIEGDSLFNAIQFECYPKEFKAQVRKAFNEKQYSELLKNLPSFKEKYQYWYSESLSIIKLLLPDRMNDFVKLYEKPRGRKKVEYGTYVIEDYLQGLKVTRSQYEKVVGPEAAIPQFQQQLNILKSVRRRFESSLFDIKQLVQADLFDSELDAARELNKKGFTRGAGAVAGVVLESHLLIEIPTWRFIQHLADLRNLCDHKKKSDPRAEDINELIVGVEKITKTLF